MIRQHHEPSSALEEHNAIQLAVAASLQDAQGAGSDIGELVGDSALFQSPFINQANRSPPSQTSNSAGPPALATNRFASSVLGMRSA
jgi:hypothetical protein